MSWFGNRFIVGRCDSVALTETDLPQSTTVNGRPFHFDKSESQRQDDPWCENDARRRGKDDKLVNRRANRVHR